MTYQLNRGAALAARIALAACLVAAAYYCLVFARASYLYAQDTATSVPAAYSLVPFNASYASRLAAWQPARKEELLKTAVALNPFDVDSWIQLGMQAELERGDAQSAEPYYLRAAEIDKMFRPKWTLANFYFRQQRPADFFRWSKATLEITPYSAEPVFAQMWLMSQDAAKLSAFIPNRPSILVQYALYLAKLNQYSAIPPVIQRLTAVVAPRDAHAYGRDDLIGPLEDHLLIAGRIEPALEIWKTLCSAHWLPYSPATEQHPLTNGDFHHPFFGYGFDWAPQNINGISVAQNPDEGTLRISFNGAEPENAPVLRQFIPLQPATDYYLSWQDEHDGTSAPSGLEWHLLLAGDAGSGGIHSEDLFSASEWRFRTDASSHFGVLILQYSRPVGSTLATGSVTLRSVSLKENASAHEKK